jgi:hypothetical protein
LALVGGWLSFLGRKEYLHRKASAGRQLTLAAGRLTDGAGKILADASAISVRTAIDWTDGTGGLRLARRLRLHFSGEEVTIFKSFDKMKLDGVRAELARLGVKPE